MPDDDDEQSQSDDPAGLRDLIKKLQRENKELRPQAASGTEATKKLAIYEAGVTDPKTVKLLAKVHDGEWTADSIKETIAEYGFGQSNASDSGAKPDERQAAIDQLGSVASGAKGTADTRKPAVDDDEAFHEELLELQAKHIPAQRGRLVDKDQYMADLEGLMNKYQVRRS